MSFCSFEFFVFLPVVFFLYWFGGKSGRFQNLFIVIASYIFYGWWDWRFLILIAFTSLCSFISGLAIKRYWNQKQMSKAFSSINIILNLGVLGIFKYYNFFADSFAALFRGIGYSMDVVTLNIILPVGISFYTFQALSYTIDVYRGKIEPTKDIIQFFAYICFFPQLVAGPIERATHLLPQFNTKRSFCYADAVDGCRQMLVGFVKKLVIADYCAMIVNMNWNNYLNYSGYTIFSLGVLFTFQIYCDFSGYSDIAIGCSKLFGIRLVRNFDYPYFSRNISEFWRRWHMSLMSWFRDYVYIPLGGSRCKAWRVAINIMLVFFISGLWHGAKWTFVIWGGYNGLLIILASLFCLNTKHKGIVAEGKNIPSVKEILSICVTFFFVVIGWIIFRSESLEQAWGITSRMFLIESDMRVLGRLPLLYCVILLIVEWIQRDKQHVLQFSSNFVVNHTWLRYSIYALLIFLLFRFSGEVQTFIYFQF